MIKKILVRAPNWVGDGVMATPALSALRSRFPVDEITLLAKPSVAALLLHHPDINRVMLYEKPGRHSGPIGFLRLVLALRKERFDTAFLLQNAFEAAAIVTLAGIPERIGYDTDGRGFLLTQSVARKSASVHQREAFFSMVAAHPEKEIEKSPTLAIQKEEISAIRARFESWGISSSDPIIAIHPGAAAGPAKQWIPERFAQVADRLIETVRAKIIILGGPNDRLVSETVLHLMKEKGIQLAGVLSLREMVAAISLCSLCITNDSGPMHIASAVGTPYVTPYGSTLPAASFPGGAHGRMIYHAVNCSPCWLAACPVNHHCMTAISTQEVLAAAEEIMKRPQRDSR
jgi:heptosyltransferase-2